MDMLSFSEKFQGNSAIAFGVILLTKKKQKQTENQANRQTDRQTDGKTLNISCAN